MEFIYFKKAILFCFVFSILERLLNMLLLMHPSSESTVSTFTFTFMHLVDAIAFIWSVHALLGNQTHELQIFWKAVTSLQRFTFCYNGKYLLWSIRDENKTCSVLLYSVISWSHSGSHTLSSFRQDGSPVVGKRKLDCCCCVVGDGSFQNDKLQWKILWVSKRGF